MFHWLRQLTFNFTGGYVVTAAFSHAVRGPPGFPRLRDPTDARSSKPAPRRSADASSLYLDAIDVFRIYDLTCGIALCLCIMAGGFFASTGAIAAFVLEDPQDGARRYEAVRRFVSTSTKSLTNN